MSPKARCPEFRCTARPMLQWAFERLRGEQWDASFRSAFGKQATKACSEVGNNWPQSKRSRTSHKSVGLYPCGVLNTVYARLRPATACADNRCVAFPTTVSEFSQLRTLACDKRFRVKLGKRAAALCRLIFGSWGKAGAFVQTYPHGALELALRQLQSEGAPLITPNSKETKRVSRAAMQPSHSQQAVTNAILKRLRGSKIA